MSEVISSGVFLSYQVSAGVRQLSVPSYPRYIIYVPWCSMFLQTLNQYTTDTDTDTHLPSKCSTSPQHKHSGLDSRIRLIVCISDTSEINAMPPVTCYICGRDFGSRSIGIHLPSCQKKWEAQQVSFSRSELLESLEKYFRRNSRRRSGGRSPQLLRTLTK